MSSQAAGLPGKRNMLDSLKVVLGTPIPFFFICYVLSLISSMGGMEIMGWTTATFTLLYILVDRFSSHQEFHTFRIGADLSVIGLVIVAVLGLVLNAPDAPFFQSIGPLRCLILLYLLSYTLELFPGINKLIHVLWVGATLVAGYAIFQHFTGIDARQLFGLRAESAVTPAPVSESGLFQSVGLFSHHLTYGYSFAMIVCFPFAGLLIGRRQSLALRLLFGLSTIVIGLSLLWTYGRGVWIAVIASFLVMATYVSRKHLMGWVVLLAIMGFGYYSISPDFRQRLSSVWSSDYFSNTDRRDLWKANIEMFTDHPWIGVGYQQNESLVPEYFKRLGIENKFAGHAHNNYFQFLATTGGLGFACYMLFILSFLLMTSRLWNEIPKTHFWHRVFVLGALGAQVSLHTGGLTQFNFGDAEVNHLFIFILAVMAYMSERYSRGIVPDDLAL